MPAPVCADELTKLYTAIMDLQTGKSVTSIGFGERNVQYGQRDLPSLLQLYNVFHRQCGETEGYPDLASTTERGRPARYSMF